MPINLQHVFHTYSPRSPFQFEALKDVHTVIDEQAFTAIIGHTGSGKSTLIQHINGLLLPTSGVIEINGMTLTAKHLPKNIKQLRQFAGVVFQFPESQLFEETVEQDVMFGPLNFGMTNLEAKQRALASLKQVGLDETFLLRSPFELSGGERRRVAIAGILAMNPKVLILDEPTAGLDPEGATQMMTLFMNLHQQGMGIILVTHDMSLVLEYASEVIVMDQGKVAAKLSPTDLFYHGLPSVPLTIPPLVELVLHCRKIDSTFPKTPFRTLKELMPFLKDRHHG